MTDAFMADSTLRQRYGLAADATFDGSFSPVALESILLYIVAACCHAVEVLFDAHLAAVTEKVEGAVVASVPWYHRMALRFQPGDSLVLDERTQQYVYPVEDSTRQPVKYAAVRDVGNSVLILASGERDGLPVPLEADVLEGLRVYLNRVKVAGVALSVRSLPADRLTIKARVSIDPLVLDTTGRRVSAGGYPVREAVERYLRGIQYGGTFNKTRLVDAIQQTEGVTDVVLGDCAYARAEAGDVFTVIDGNNYSAASGCFVAVGLENSLTYVVED